MIPALVEIHGAPFRVLPPGIHWTSLSEIKERFAVSSHRHALFGGIVHVATALKVAGCCLMYIDGSFASSKPHPGDFGGCWDARGVSTEKLDKALLDFSQRRKAQKQKFLGEMFILTSPGTVDGTFLEFFQLEKHTGKPKGILGVDLKASDADLGL